MAGLKQVAVWGGGALVVLAAVGGVLPHTGSHRAGPTAATSSPTTTRSAVPDAPKRATAAAPSAAQLIAAAPPRTALALLGTLAVKGRAPKTGYSRDQFGPAWADTDRNGCDTRDDVLKRDLTGVTFRAGTHGCVVLTGRLADPYTGRTLAFSKSDAGAVQIDHVVALSDAWQTGAQTWAAGTRLAFANDPLELLAVDAGANDAKSDSDAASWLPPNKGYRCAMVARQVAVKAAYGLWVTPAERDAIARVLSTCPGRLVPTGGAPTQDRTAVTTTSVDAQTYASCTEMHAVYPGGVARPGAVDKRSSGHATYPPHVSQALYDANAGRDRDHDGVACER